MTSDRPWLEPGWWKSGLIYQIYPRSFADSNGDGVGDLQGIINHLDHLAWLGVDGLWLSPTMPSPNADWGYDVAGYSDVSPDFGTLDDLDRLISAARQRGIAILLDLVPNHTSDQHPWFVEARSSRSSARRDWYVWADPAAGGGPPNNWVSSFGGPAWTLEPDSGQFYLHNFLPEQPDLNWWNEDVRAEFDAILRFWFDRGIAGFRIDVANMVVKDRDLRDNPPATRDDHWMVQVFGQRSVYNSNRPEVHDVLHRWREVAEGCEPPRVLIGETNVEELDTLVSFYGTGEDELHLAFNFVFIESPFEATALSTVVAETEARLPPGAWPVWTGSNHDVSRFASRWAAGDPAKTRLALLVLLTLRGTPVLYQGDELGLIDAVLAEGDLRDPVGLRFWPAYAGRDAVRTPMPWADRRGGGFTDPGVTPWLPLGELGARTVEAQRRDPDSMLHYCRDLIAVRRGSADLQTGAYQSDPSPAGTWVWRRGAGVAVVANLSDVAQDLELNVASCRVLIATDRRRDGELIEGGRFSIGPWQGVVLGAS